MRRSHRQRRKTFRLCCNNRCETSLSRLLVLGWFSALRLRSARAPGREHLASANTVHHMTVDSLPPSTGETVRPRRRSLLIGGLLGAVIGAVTIWLFFSVFGLLDDARSGIDIVALQLR